MPHRPERNGTISSPGVAVYSQYNGLSGEAAAHIMRPNTSSSSVFGHPAGVVTPLMSSKPFFATPTPGPRGMVPSLEKPKSSDSTDRSTGTKHDEECTVATLTTEASADELEKREATATALFALSAAAIRHEVKLTEGSSPELGNSDPATPEGLSTSNKVPLKKRKKHLDFLRRNEDTEPESDGKPGPCHVSPVSHSSTGSARVEGRTVSRDEVTPDRPGRRMTPPAKRSPSFDSKGSPYKESTQELLNSSKIHNATDIALPAQVVIPHFPSVLHQVLSDSEYSGSVLSWLPDGESWKVLRWDALRRQILPRYFATLRDENGTGCGTIDAFLWHLTSWGFEEVKDGTDVGAYKHDLFIRGAQKLCSKMRFTGPPAPEGPKTVSPARPSAADDRSMLQVPTLSSYKRADVVDSDASTASNETPTKRPRYEEQSASIVSSTNGAIRRQSPGPLNWMGYRPKEYSDPSAWGHYYSDPSRMYHNGVYHDPRYHPSGPNGADAMPGAVAPLYSPPQVRSGRGAIRVSGSNRKPSNSSPVNTPSQSISRPAFPVSNRGKGRKTAAACRATLPGSVSIDSTSTQRTRGSPTNNSSSVTLEEAQRIGSAVQGVAIAVSRKTKRKLPLSRNHNEKTPTPTPSVAASPSTLSSSMNTEKK